MSGLTCEYCGGRSVSKSEACSTGCDLARRLPRGDGDLPATWQLGVLLAWGFALFNQLLFAGMEHLALGSEAMEKAGKFGVASLAVGALVVLANGFLYVISKPKRFVDWQVLCLTAAVLFVLWGRLGHLLGNAGHVFFALGNVLVALWLSRGLWRKPASKKEQKA